MAEETTLHHLALRRRHRFAEYKLAFDVDVGPGGVTLSARTSAAFPGIAGRLYRALVIGSGVHRVVVRRMLSGIERRAERAP